MATEQINTYDPADNSPEALMDTVDEQRTGYVALSLTEYTTTTVPAIAIGSEIEINGALFKTLDSTDPVTVGGVADGTVYILATPSGVSPDQIATFSFTATAPTWFDSKQGFYNAGGTARYVGFAMTKAGTSYSDKKQFFLTNNSILSFRTNKIISSTGIIQTDNVDASGYAHFDGGVSTDGGVNVIKTTILEIGDWDMVAATAKNVGISIPYKNIRSLTGRIRDDNDSSYWVLPFVTDTAVECWFSNDSGSGLTLGRRSGGQFDDVLFDSTSYNRGWIYIAYV